MRKKKAKSPQELPGCMNYCMGRLQGIVENGKLTGNLPEEFTVSIKPIIGLMWIPGGSYTMTCEHGKKFLVQDVTGKEKKR